MLPVRVIPNFLPVVECTGWIELINELEKARRSEFVTYTNDEKFHRLALQFGEKNYGDQSPRPNLDILGEKELEARRIFSRVVNAAQQEFDMNELFPSVFWLAKQYPGSKIHFHEDTDGGNDSHLVISSLVYLNGQSEGGDLRFPKFNYTYTPKAGDLVMFDTVAAGMHGVTTICEERYSLPLWLTRDRNHQL